MHSKAETMLRPKCETTCYGKLKTICILMIYKFCVTLCKTLMPRIVFGVDTRFIFEIYTNQKQFTCSHVKTNKKARNVVTARGVASIMRCCYSCSILFVFEKSFFLRFRQCAKISVLACGWALFSRAKDPLRPSVWLGKPWVQKNLGWASYHPVFTKCFQLLYNDFIIIVVAC